jgi:hypothetical protein
MGVDQQEKREGAWGRGFCNRYSRDIPLVRKLQALAMSCDVLVGSWSSYLRGQSQTVEVLTYIYIYIYWNTSR